jgi:tetrapyrrole methylase family protein/MazG family protein
MKIKDNDQKERVTLEALVELMATLRGEHGCPWDKKQTKASIKPYIIEEAYEVVEAVDEQAPQRIQEELGDLLFQIIFYAQLLSEEDGIDIYDIMKMIQAKMIRRHPHVFGEINVKNAEEVLVNWEQIKQEEKKEERSSLLEGIPKDLPSLLRAHRIQSKVSHVGFEWENFNQILEKLDEEFYELRHAYKQGDIEKIEDEFGDVLFVLVSIARFLNINPDGALRKAMTKFTTRFGHIEQRMKEMGKEWKDMTGEEMDQLWKESKVHE